MRQVLFQLAVLFTKAFTLNRVSNSHKLEPKSPLNIEGDLGTSSRVGLQLFQRIGILGTLNNHLIDFVMQRQKQHILNMISSNDGVFS